MLTVHTGVVTATPLHAHGLAGIARATGFADLAPTAVCITAAFGLGLVINTYPRTGLGQAVELLAVLLFGAMLVAETTGDTHARCICCGPAYTDLARTAVAVAFTPGLLRIHAEPGGIGNVRRYETLQAEPAEFFLAGRNKASTAIPLLLVWKAG